MSASEALIKQLKNDLSKNTDPFNGFLTARTLLYQTIIEIKFHHHINAAWTLRSAYLTIEKNKQSFPGFLPNYMVSGALQCMIGAVPSNYEWLLRLAGVNGSISQGRNELVRLLSLLPYSNFACFTDDVLFMLASLQSSLFPDWTAPAVFEKAISNRASSSGLLLYAYTSLLMKQSRNDDALILLNQWSISKQEYPFYFLYYRRGLARLRKLDFTAENDFKIFLAAYHGISYRNAALQKLAWIYLLQHDKEAYIKFIGQCKSDDDLFLDEDKEAVSEALSGKTPSAALLKSRLLFDGGYFKEALKEIMLIRVTTLLADDQRLEYHYRKARINQGLKNIEFAKQGYQLTLVCGKNSANYFAANSALLLAGIYESQQKKDSALFYYQECLSIRHHAYQNSIDQKAKAGIDRLKN
jgi:hypothetical protein